MTAPGNTQVQTRADDERRRAARTAEIAERHEEWVDGEPFLLAFHSRMATIHRQVQRQHLAAAALHTALADRVRPRIALAAESPMGLRVTSSRAHPSVGALVDLLEVQSDVDRFFSRFVAHCVTLLDVTAATLLVADHLGRLGIAGSSSATARLFTGAELSGGAGPSAECHLTGDRRAYPDCSALAACWPNLAGTARAASIAAVYTIPLRHRDQVLGVLTLLDDRPARLSDEALQFAQLLAAVAVVGLTNQRRIGHYQRTAAQLQVALTSRVAIEQAKGILAERLDIAVDAAFDLLRGHARASNRKLHELAAEIIDRSLDISTPGSNPAAPLTHTPSRHA